MAVALATGMSQNLALGSDMLGLNSICGADCNELVGSFSLRLGVRIIPQGWLMIILLVCWHMAAQRVI